MPAKITISIVTYHPDIALLNKVINSVDFSVELAYQRRLISEYEILLVDNGSDFTIPSSVRTSIEAKYPHVRILTGHGNVGYGSGNNLAIKNSTGDYFVVLNPDVILEQDTISSALTFMSENPDCGLLAPAAFDHQGRQLSICKRYPSVFDLAIRGFAPHKIRDIFEKRLAKYEMQELLNQEKVFWNPQLVSGCFMLFRTEVLSYLQGFNPEYFMYFEDFDISIRTRKVSDIAYVPAVKIEHYGGNAARKGIKHIAMFARSANTFFNTHGWQWF